YNDITLRSGCSVLNHNVVAIAAIENDPVYIIVISAYRGRTVTIEPPPVAKDPVITFAALDDIGPETSFQNVVAIATDQLIVTRIASQLVITCTATDNIVADGPMD